MKSSLETLSSLERKLNIEVPSEEVQAAFEQALKGVQRSVAVKGFRKGKAPLQTIRTLYGERIRQDIIQDIIQENFVTALKEHQLAPINAPAIEFDPLTDGQAFVFSAEFEIRPEISAISYDDLTVKKEKLDLTDASVEAAIEAMRKERAETVPVLEDRAAQLGDIAVIDFKGYINGADLEHGTGFDHPLELGSNSFIPGFEDKIVGMRIGVENKIQISFPADYQAKELAGQAAEFDVKLKELKKKSLPELNDEFAKALGPFDSLESLKTTIREEQVRRETKRINDDMRNRLMKALVERSPVAVPKSLLGEQKKALVEDFERRMVQQGMRAEQYEDYKSKWDGDFEKTASYMIQSSFLIDKLAGDHNLRASAEDVHLKLENYSAESGIELKQLKEFYADKDQRARLSYQLTEEKVIDFLLSKAHVVELTKAQLETETKA